MIQEISGWYLWCQILEIVSEQFGDYLEANFLLHTAEIETVLNLRPVT